MWPRNCQKYFLDRFFHEYWFKRDFLITQCKNWTSYISKIIVVCENMSKCIEVSSQIRIPGRPCFYPNGRFFLLTQNVSLSKNCCLISRGPIVLMWSLDHSSKRVICEVRHWWWTGRSGSCSLSALNPSKCILQLMSGLSVDQSSSFTPNSLICVFMDLCFKSKSGSTAEWGSIFT